MSEVRPVPHAEQAAMGSLSAEPRWDETLEGIFANSNRSQREYRSAEIVLCRLRPLRSAIAWPDLRMRNGGARFAGVLEGQK